MERKLIGKMTKLLGMSYFYHTILLIISSLHMLTMYGMLTIVN